MIRREQRAKQDASVLWWVAHLGDATCTEVAEACRREARVVRRSLQRLSAAGLIAAEPWPTTGRPAARWRVM